MSGKIKIFIIDDDEAIITHLVIKLSKHYDVVSTTKPEMAVAMARNEKPDVILCDIDMPDMTGGEVAAALAAEPQTARIPLIYLTALVSAEEARELGSTISGKPGVSKRSSVNELMQMINSELEAR